VRKQRGFPEWMLRKQGRVFRIRSAGAKFVGSLRRGLKVYESEWLIVRAKQCGECSPEFRQLVFYYCPYISRFTPK